MSNDRLSAVLRASLGDLIESLAQAVETPISVLDSSGQTVLGTHGPAGDDDARPGSHAGAISAPICTSEGQVGSVVASSDRPELCRLVRSLASHVGRCSDLESDVFEMTDQLSHSYDEISLIYRFARVIKPDESLPSNAGRILEETADLFEGRFLIASIPDEDCLIWSASPGLDISQSQRWIAEDESALGRIHADLAIAAPQGTPPGGVRHQGSVTTPFGVVRYAVTPVCVRQAVAGYAGLFRTDDQRPFATGELQLVESLVQELSNAATNKKLNQELYELIFDVMRSLVAAIEAKDEYTSGHSERVFRLSILIAKRLGLPAGEVKTLSWAALLHDIGKIAIKGEVLRKSGRLTEEEYRLIQTHPARGCRVLEPIRQFSDMLPAIRHHHERYDGKGYPDGLKGEEIPLMARIIAVADSFDAMVSARPYRPAGALDFALSEIRAGSGGQFDPKIAAAFLEGAMGNLAYAGFDAEESPDGTRARGVGGSP